MTFPITHYNSDNEVQIMFASSTSTLRNKYAISVIIFILIHTGWSDTEFYFNNIFMKKGTLILVV